MAELVADTYALVAYYNGSRAYRAILDRRDFVTTNMNLLELAHALLRSGAVTEESLPNFLSPLENRVIGAEPAAVPAAAAFKLGMNAKGLNCSYVDAWGYATARALDVPFLTGDEAFRKVPHVEFVKG